MQIHQPPTVSESSRHVCDFHKRHPGKRYAGCTCSGSFSVRTKPMSEWTEEERRRYYADLRPE